jgi:hypothetical protein
MMNKFFILSAVLVFTSCDNTRVQEPAHDETALRHPIDIWCRFNHDDILQKNGDSLFIFSEVYAYADAYTMIIDLNSKDLENKTYNTTFYATDSLNALYNVMDDTHEPKMFFEGLTVKLNAARLNQIEKRLDKLFDETGPESYEEMIDGSSIFSVTYKRRTKMVNTGPMVARWRAYSVFLRDTVLSPYRQLKAKGRREVESNHR